MVQIYDKPPEGLKVIPDEMSANRQTATAEVANSNPGSLPGTEGRNLDGEKAYVSRYGAPTNRRDELDMAIALYGENLPQEFQSLRDELDSASGDRTALDAAGSRVESLGQSATMYNAAVNEQRGNLPGELNILQDALKTVSGVGSQPLGESEVFKAAGVGGIGALSGSLNARLKEMQFKGESYANVVTKIASSKFAANNQLLTSAQQALDSYNLTLDKYKFEQSRLDGIEAEARAYERELDLIDRRHQNALEEIAYKTNVEKENTFSWRSLYDGDTNGTYVTADGEYVIPPGTSLAQGEITVLGNQSTGDLFGAEYADNCVKYARLFAPDLPYGLWSTRDKAAVVNESIDVPQAGDIMLTAEGDWGHAAVVHSVLDKNGDGKPDTAILQEANYRAGQIMIGREVDLSSGAILGYHRSGDPNIPGQFRMSTTYDIQLAAAEATGDENKIMQLTNEGMNPKGAEAFAVGGASYTPNDLMDAYSIVLNAAGIRGDSAEEEKNTFAFDYAYAGDFEGAKQLIMNTALSSMSSAEASDIRDSYSIVALMTDVRQKINAYEKSGGDMGLFRGGVQNVLAKLYKSGDPQLLSISTDLQIVTDNYARLKTGAALTKSEEDFYKKMFPNIAGGYGFNIQKIDDFINAVDTQTSARLSSVMGQAQYDKIFGYDALIKERGYTDDDIQVINSTMQNMFQFGY